MKKTNKVVDERQRMDFLNAEHYAFWAMLITAGIALIIQSYLLNMELKQYIGELAILIVGCAVSLIESIRKGNWDYHTQPNVKNYFKISAFASVIATVIFSIGKLYSYEMIRENVVGLLLPISGIFFISIFLLCFGVLALTGSLAKKKQKILEKQFLEDE